MFAVCRVNKTKLIYLFRFMRCLTFIPSIFGVSVLAIVLLGILGAEGTTKVHKAKLGETVVLPCPSDDKLHRFQYWLLKNEQVVGPWNNLEGNRVRYEVWSGRLIIKKVSEEESGLYRCFSKKILGGSLKSEPIELLVLKDWEDSFENDPKVNIYRVVIVILVLLIVFMIPIFILCKRRRKSFKTFKGSREESPEFSNRSINNEIYRATNVSLKKPANLFNTNKNKENVEKPLESAIIETDISSSFSLPHDKLLP